MRFSKTRVAGCFTVEIEPHIDHRGFFARAYCPSEFSEMGINFTSVQFNLARSTAQYTLRGMHYATGELAEAKLVRCVRGRVYDVVLDIRADSPTFGAWAAVELDARRSNAMFVPENCAHGYMTLEPDSDVLYQMSKLYVPGQDRTVRWDDPSFRVVWPAAPSVMSPNDFQAPDWAG